MSKKYKYKLDRLIKRSDFVMTVDDLNNLDSPLERKWKNNKLKNQEETYQSSLNYSKSTNSISRDEIINFIFQYEFENFIGQPEDGGYPGWIADIENATEPYIYIPPTVSEPTILLTAPHATMTYRHYGGSSNPDQYTYCAETNDNNNCLNAFLENPLNAMLTDEICCGKVPDGYTGAMTALLAQLTGQPALIVKYRQDDPNYYDDFMHPIQSPAFQDLYGLHSSPTLHPFKAAIEQTILNNPSIEVVFDIHGASYTRPFEIDLGTGYGSSLITDWSQNLPDIVRDNMIDIPNHGEAYEASTPNCTEDCGITQDMSFPAWGSESVVKWVSGGYNHDEDCYIFDGGFGETEVCYDHQSYINPEAIRPGIQFEINGKYRGRFDDNWGTMDGLYPGDPDYAGWEHPGRYSFPWGIGEPWDTNMYNMIQSFVNIIDYVVDDFDNNVELVGDINGDGALNVLDIVLLVNLILSGNYNENGDMNGDGVLNILDIVELANIVGGGGRATEQQPIPIPDISVVGKPYNGNVLFTPKGQGGGNNQTLTTYLMDKNNDIVNEWVMEGVGAPASAPYLLPSGNMIYPCKINSNPYGLSSAASGGRIIEYDWDGNVVWDWTIPVSWNMLPHHDIEPLPNGDILLIVIEDNEYGGTSDAIIQIRPNYVTDDDGNIIDVGTTADIVWEWHVTDHLGTGPYKFDSENTWNNGSGSINEGDWNHFNAIYLNELDRIYLSSRNWDEFYVIKWGGGNGPSGDILYRWGNPQNYGRGSEEDHILLNNHGVNEIPYNYPGGSNIILFNNGGQLGMTNADSAVLEINPPVDENGNYIIEEGQPFGPTEPIWEYWGTPGSSIEGFYSGRQSGAFRLPNGNTFVIVAADTFLPVEIESNTGHMFEVDRNGNIVWEYIAEGGMAISRAHQYGKDYLNFNEI